MSKILRDHWEPSKTFLASQAGRPALRAALVIPDDAEAPGDLSMEVRQRLWGGALARVESVALQASSSIKNLRRRGMTRVYAGMRA